MTNQQFKDLLESNGIKTREHQFFDFCFGDFGVMKQMDNSVEVSIVYNNLSSIFFDEVEFKDSLVFFKNRNNTIGAIPKRGLV